MNKEASAQNVDRTPSRDSGAIAVDTKATVVESPDATSGVSWARVYECPSPTAFRQRYDERPEERGWIAVDRTLAARLDSTPTFDSELHP